MQDGSDISHQPGRQRWGTRGTAGALFAGRLTFENVSCSIGSTEILKDLSFELQAGEIACLLGQSGCGKTTLLRIAAGIQRPTAGRVLLDGEEVDGPTRYVPPERRNVGLVFQDFALFPHLTVIENVAFGLSALSRGEAAKVAEHALARVGLASFRDSYPSSLSGGEQQRVALARAIVPRPQVMLMDEPFSGLDQRLRETVRGETLALLQETRATCVLVTHDPVEAMDFADRILLMRAGRLIQTGSSVDLFNRPADLQVARFFSDVNELGAIVKNGNVETPLGTFSAAGFDQGTEVVVIVRPQALSLAQAGAGTEGYVLEARFLGDKTRLQVQFNGVDEPLAVLLSGLSPQRGETAHFRVDHNHVLIFTKPAPDSI
ncbi:MAG TPA: ABC transporter ATP-binding protein [Aestuariivirga sp.]|jgi:iron(III) transport system ATP-binding protein|nr:ABC transporter ATP-binding protein [Hyphomicrobiales bacterium]MCC7483057.1 ABC transporter ATP-binding protein [Hyphomicrobiales bacterium]HQX85222.1 ABC transporter ATP-binding protein [Aestuariivirga sp.]HQY74323.1 ABC transporter ATP-binding protein [Aestuariivirga sp.]HRA93152.1 ABC transporter ATP-binding protein [Aestuariivirga sp.]